MAESEHDRCSFEPCFWRICPAIRPVMSTISSPLPFSDWACPSLPSQHIVKSSIPFGEGAHAKNWQPLAGFFALRNQGLKIADCLAPMSLSSMDPTFGPGNASLEWQGLPKGTPTSIDQSDQSNLRSTSSAEQVSAVIDSLSPKRNCADPIAETMHNLPKRKIHVNSESYAATSADLAHPLQRLPSLENNSRVKGALAPEISLASAECNENEEVHIRSGHRGTSPSLGSCLPAAAEDSGSSESGWTTYFQSSTDCWTTFNSMLPWEEAALKHAREGAMTDSKQTNSHLFQHKSDDSRDDSSIASDASSGPEQLLQESGPLQGQQWQRSQGNQKLLTQSKRSYGAAMDASQCSAQRPPKLRRLHAIDLQIPAQCGLEDTASSPLQSPIFHQDNEDTEQPYRTCLDDPTNLHGVRLSPEVQPKAITDRLEALQDLIPNGKKLNEEEMLTVTIDYVRALELKVKMFKNADFGESVDLLALGNAGRGASRVVGELQGRGLCLMPLSFLANAL